MNLDLNHTDQRLDIPCQRLTSLCTIIKNIRNSVYIEYETSLLIEYIEKYPSLIQNYTKEIFDEYIEYFINLYRLYNKTTIQQKRTLSQEIFTKLCNFLFLNKDNKFIESNIEQVAYFASGCDMIKCYINRGNTFDLKQTRVLINSIVENPNHEIRETIIQLFNDFDAFEADESLIEYAAFIPINKYVYRSIEKNIKITKQCYYNIIKYPNDLELCTLALKYDNTLIDSNCLNYACQSRNKEVIMFVLNNKITPDNKIFESIFLKKNNRDVYRFKTSDINFEENVFLDFEENNLIRTVHRNQYCTENDIIKILDKYGYCFTYDDFFVCLENRVLMENFDFDFGDDKLTKKFFDVCIQKSFYPYFINKKKFPPPTIECLYKECERKNNMKVIKQLAESLKLYDKLELVGNILKIAWKTNNDNVMRYFIEKCKKY